jgi:hypothetical protein
VKKLTMSFETYVARIKARMARIAGGPVKFFPDLVDLQRDYDHDYSVEGMADHYLDLAIDQAKLAAGVEVVNEFA